MATIYNCLITIWLGVIPQPMIFVLALPLFAEDDNIFHEAFGSIIFRMNIQLQVFITNMKKTLFKICSTQSESIFKNFIWKWRFLIWTASSEFGTYHLCEQRGFRRACSSAQSRQNLRCSLIQAVSQEEPSDKKARSLSLWMAGHVQLKFVMTECSKTQIRLTGLIWYLGGFRHNYHQCQNHVRLKASWVCSHHDDSHFINPSFSNTIYGKKKKKKKKKKMSGNPNDPTFLGST